MASRLLDLFRLGRCSHEFSWPRRWPDGQYYQVCLVCGDEYRYDWKTMSRLERVSGKGKQGAPARAAGRDGPGSSEKKPRWSPRARRIKLHDHELKYRAAGTTAWHCGAVENVSQTGVLFRAGEVLPENTELELIMEMPPEITGQEHAQVIARGMVVRTVPAESNKGKPAMAAGIWDYRVLHDKENPEAAAAANDASEPEG
ncbi:MAG TPA: hypothetical protein VE734_07915 [Terriglobales bacterium]|jgi:hypothetical protein|nr:hypothetical protein [Terriglobales bacterium]